MQNGAIKFIGRRPVYPVPDEWDEFSGDRRRESERARQSAKARRSDEEAVQQRSPAGRE